MKRLRRLAELFCCLQNKQISHKDQIFEYNSEICLRILIDVKTAVISLIFSSILLKTRLQIVLNAESRRFIKFIHR